MRVSDTYRTLIYPFDKWTWIGVGLSVVAVGVALWLLRLEDRTVPMAPHKPLSHYDIVSIAIVTLLSESLPLSIFDMRSYSK